MYKVGGKMKEKKQAKVETKKELEISNISSETSEEPQVNNKPKILTIFQALEELRKQKKRKFNQSVDLIINLRDFDAKKQSINLFVNLPNKIKKVKIGAFLENKSSLVDTITLNEFNKYSDKKEMKKLLKDYDYFIAFAKLMPKIATTFGRVLGPAGKMPNPQLGIIADESESSIKAALEKFEKIIRIKTIEPSIKLTIGKESMKNEEIEANIKSVYKAVEKALPKQKENIKNIMVKFTMTKPIKVEVK